MKLSELRPLLDKVAILNLSDGETAKVKVLYVWEEYDDITVDILETSNPERYAKFGHTDLSKAAFNIAAKDILSVQDSN